MEQPTSRFCLYARKSSETDERQTHSINAQLKEMRAIAEREQLKVVATISESHSAKLSGSRPEFLRMIDGIKSRKFDAIITWAPDRLSRNAGDLGCIIDLMDQNLLTEIRTYHQVIRNIPTDKFLLMILCSQAKLENDNRGVCVKRGLGTAAGLGFRPCQPPTGYALEYDPHLKRNIAKPDPHEAPMVRKLFDLVGNQGLSGLEAYFFILEEGYKTKWGKPFKKSVAHSILRNPFYTGKFEYPVGSGKWHQGKHEPLISHDLFKRTRQRIEENTVEVKWGYKKFAFSRMMLCGVCGAGIIGMEKLKTKEDGTVKRYIYYVCSGAKQPKCSKKGIREENVIAGFRNLLKDEEIFQSSFAPRLETMFQRYQNFWEAFGPKDAGAVPVADRVAFALYILTRGDDCERQEMASMLRGKLFVENRQLRLACKNMEEHC